MEAMIMAIVGAIAQVAPGLIAAWTGQHTDEAAIALLRKIVDGLPVRGGEDGAWAKDLEERRKRIEASQPARPEAPR